MSRWKAAGIHFSISILIGLLVLALLFGVWYPGPYFDAAGGQHLVIVLLCVDLVLGPLLTLILFKSGKKGMLFDLTMIALLQFSALVYGVYVIAQSRPVFIVAAIDRFTVVSAADLDAADLAKGREPQFRSLSWTGPRIIAARLPDDPKQRDMVLDSGIAGKDLEQLPQHYVDYSSEAANLLKRAKSVATLRELGTTAGPIVDAWLTKTGRDAASVAWLPVNARRASLAMMLDAKNGEVLDALPIDPW